MVILSISLIVVFTIWTAGTVHLWRLQSASRRMTSVRFYDRLFALCWLPVALFFLIISVPQLCRSLLVRRQRRTRAVGRTRQAP